MLNIETLNVGDKVRAVKEYAEFALVPEGTVKRVERRIVTIQPKDIEAAPLMVFARGFHLYERYE